MIPLGVMASGRVAPAVTGYDGAVLSDSPLAYWPLNEGTGLPQDASGNGHHLATFGSATTPWVTDGVLGPVMNGLTVTYQSPVRCPQTAYTIEAWVRRDGTTTADSSPIGDWGGTAGAVGAMPYFGLNSQVLSGFHRGTSLPSGVSTTTGWHHLAITWNGTTITSYMDGVQRGQWATTTAPGVGERSLVGSYGSGYADGIPRRFPGKIARAAWYATALSSTRISAHYAAGL